MHYPQYFCTLCDLSQLNNYYEDSCIYPSLCSINENEDIVLQSESKLNVKGGLEGGLKFLGSDFGAIMIRGGVREKNA